MRMELNNKRVLVVGLALTGVATALFCAARGAKVTATESRNEKDIGEAVDIDRAHRSIRGPVKADGVKNGIRLGEVLERYGIEDVAKNRFRDGAAKTILVPSRGRYPVAKTVP